MTKIVVTLVHSSDSFFEQAVKTDATVLSHPPSAHHQYPQISLPYLLWGGVKPNQRNTNLVSVSINILQGDHQSLKTIFQGPPSRTIFQGIFQGPFHFPGRLVAMDVIFVYIIWYTCTVELGFNENPRSRQKYSLKASSRYFRFSSLS